MEKMSFACMYRGNSMELIQNQNKKKIIPEKKKTLSGTEVVDF